MAFRDNIKFVLKGKEYILDYHFVKDLPIFQELKKSDKLETIEYVNNISDDNICYAFEILYGIYRKNEILVESFIEVVFFLKYLCVEQVTINNFIRLYASDYDYKSLIELGIKNNYSYEYYEMICKYDFKIEVISVEEMKNFELDECIKKLFIKKNIDFYIDEILKHSCDKLLCIIYAVDVSTKNYSYEYDNYNYKQIYPIKYLYRKIFKDDTIKFKVEVEKMRFKCFKINDKIIDIVGNTDLYLDHYIGIDLYDTIVNHITMVYLGKVEL